MQTNAKLKIHSVKKTKKGGNNQIEGAFFPAANTTGSAMSSPAGNDVYRSMVLAFRMSELQVGDNRNVNHIHINHIPFRKIEVSNFETTL